MMERKQMLHLVFSNGYYHSITITRLGLIIGGCGPVCDVFRVTKKPGPQTYLFFGLLVLHARTKRA